MANANDVLMYINLTTGGMMAAEGRSDVSNDDLTEEFLPGCYFELKSFSFGVKLHDKGAADKAPHKGGHPQGGYSQGGRPQGGQGGRSTHDASEGHAKKAQVPFAAFYEGGSLETVPVELNEISFERVLDKGSATLWNYFMTKEVVPSAAIVKRKDSGASHPMGYLKFQFQELLVIEIEWEESDVLLIEKTKMICRSAQIIYKKQNADNSFAPQIGPGWGYINGAF